MSVFDNDPAERGASFYEAPPHPDPADQIEIAAALSRFHAKLACANYLPRTKVSRVWAACALLTIAAFGGGLSLARFSFNTAEPIASVLNRAPELIYLPPQSPATAFADLQSALPPVPMIALGESSQTRDAEPWVDRGAGLLATATEMPGNDFVDPGTGDLNLNELGRSWAEAVRIANAMQWSNDARASEPLQHGYAAVEVSAIPEPSTGLVVAMAVAIIVAGGHAAKRCKRGLRVAHQHLL